MNIKSLLVGSAAALAAVCLASAASAMPTPPSAPAKDIIFWGPTEVATCLDTCIAKSAMPVTETLATPDLLASNETGVAPAFALKDPGPKDEKFALGGTKVIGAQLASTDPFESKLLVGGGGFNFPEGGLI